MPITPRKTETKIIISNWKVTLLKALSVSKLEIEAAIIRIRLNTTVQKQTTFKIHETHSWTDSRFALDCIASKKQQKLFAANPLREIHESSKSIQRHYIPSNQTPVDHGTRDLEPNKLCFKWLQAPDFLKKTLF